MFECVPNFLDKVSDVLWRDWKLKLVWDPPINILFKKREEGKVKPGALCIKTLKNGWHFIIWMIIINDQYEIETHIFDLLIFWNSSVIDQRVIVKKQSAGDVESDEHVNTVVLMSSKDEEDSKTVA